MQIPHSIKQKLIVALDVESMDEAIRIARELKPYTHYFKVGLELINRAGAPQIVSALKKEGVGLFFDGKFHDIPNTIGQATGAIADLGVDIMNVHLSSGPQSLKAAVKKKGKSLLFGVSVLTSISPEEGRQIYNSSLEEIIEKMTLMAIESGLDGVICSPLEIDKIRKLDKTGNLKIMTPGIRPGWSEKNDQVRTLTPKEALDRGVDYMVVGRPILKPPPPIKSPIEAAEKFWKEILS